MKNKLYIIASIIFAIIAFVCLGMPAARYIKNYLAEKQYEKLDNTPNWEELASVNQDIYAWIYVPNTNINYPVFQHPSDDNYYLDHNMDGSVGLPGCIYSEGTYNGTDFTDFHTVLYGHNMKNETMFHTLHNFSDEAFFNENLYFYIYTPSATYKYEIFAAYENSNEHLLANYPLQLESQRISYLNHALETAKETGFIREAILPTSEDLIVTLSTCIGSDTSRRYVVQGVLIETNTGITRD